MTANWVQLPEHRMTELLAIERAYRNSEFLIWVSIDDRLPCGNSLVIVAIIENDSDACIEVGRFKETSEDFVRSSGKFIRDADGSVIENVSAWHYLPDLDKSKFKSRSLTTAVRDDGGAAVHGEGQTGCTETGK